MIFQAWRIKGFTPAVPRWDQITVVNSRRFSSVRVLCAPVRSSFSAALADAKRFRELGFCSAVRVFSPTNQL